MPPALLPHLAHHQCWGKTPEIQSWMDDNGFTEDDAYLYYFNRVTEIAIAQGREVVGWDEIWEK